MNSIDRRLERLRAKMAGTYIPKVNPVPAVPSGKKPCFKVTSGNVVVLVCDVDQTAAMNRFGRMMALGPPFENSALSDIMQIKDLRNDRVWYASTVAALSATSQ